MNRFLITGISALALAAVFAAVSAAQPAGEEITIINDTPTFEEAGLEAFTPEAVLLARTSGEDREPKASVLGNGAATVFWVNRNGSHHYSGIDAEGNRMLPLFDVDNDDDVIVGDNTGSNTNWTLNKADQNNNVFMIAATYQAGTLSDTSIIPDTVVDADGIRLDDSQGHGFFKLVDGNLEILTEDPISISQFSAGHREWDCCWLSDGKLVIGSVSRDHRYEADPDFPSGGNNIATINIFNPDGTRYKDEFFVGSDLSGQQKNVRLGALANGFVCVYEDDKSLAGGENLQKGIIYDNEGEMVTEFVARDQELGIGVDWMDAGGGDRFVTVHQASGPEGIGLPEVLVGQPIIMAQLWNAMGERMGGYIVVSQHDDFRGLGRPRCAMAQNGSFALSWEDHLADDVDFTRSVAGRVFNADGTPATDAFVAHPLPEFTIPGKEPPESTGGGDPGEPILAMSNERVAFAWATRAAPEGQARDIAATVFANPAEGTDVGGWELY